MTTTLQKRPFIVGPNKNEKLERIPLTQGEFSEEWLQKLLQESPQLLPVAEIDSIYAPLVCIGREVHTNVGYIDNLYVSPKGYITIVETKLWRNPQARREVVGQIIDYAKELKQFTYEKLDHSVRAYNQKYHNKELGIFDSMVEQNLLVQEDEALFTDMIAKNLSNARFLLLVVGDGIRDSVWRMAEFLNSTPNMLYNIALVELEVYKVSEEERLVVPNLLMKTEILERFVFRVENGSAIPIESVEKEVIDKNNNAMYFSRSVIPFVRDADKNHWQQQHTFYKHVGMYAFTPRALQEFANLSQTSLEIAESLEQNRWLENGYRIKVAKTEFETIAVDTMEDLERVRRLIR